MSLCSHFSTNVNNDDDAEEGADDGDGDGDDEGVGSGILLDLVGVGGKQEISSLIVGIGVGGTCCQSRL